MNKLVSPADSTRLEAISLPLDVSTPKHRPKILVVGDWVIDEHWVTTIHRSKTRSRAGINHYRSIQEPDGCVLTLAGAGKTTSILYEAVADPKSGKGCFEVVGVGIWHPDDESTLGHLLNPDNARGQTHHRLTYPPAQPVPDVHLFNIGPAVNNKLNESVTTRVIRIYQQTGLEYVLLDRIDWELPRADKRQLRPHRLKLLKQYLKGVDAVILKDMAKGVIDEDIIRWLREQLGQSDSASGISRQPAWFISSKKWLPDWHTALPKESVRLFIVPQVAANAAAEEPGFSRWLTGDGSVTKEALDRFVTLAQSFPQALVCVLPRGLSVIARTRGQTEAILLKQPVEGEGLDTEGVPMASVFLPTLVAFLLEIERQVGSSEIAASASGTRFEVALKSALNFTESWMRKEAKRITDAKTWQADNRDHRVSLSFLGTKQFEQNDRHPFLPRWTRDSWQDGVNEWEQAYRERGIIKRARDTKEEYGVLQLKRSMVEVDGYVCCVEAKRQVLRRLTAEIQSFNPNDRVSKAFMLKAAPGSGKSYLISKLAELHHLQLLQFNITSLLSRNDLLDCFDTIVTTQARARYKKYLVFFDEINSHLEGDLVYDTFLRPLEEGLYVRAGKSFYLDPCIWIFAGTRDPSAKDDGSRTEHLSNEIKGSDFVSRLSDIPFRFEFGWEHQDEFKTDVDARARLENVYAGSTLIKRAFPDVTHAEETVLEIFRVIPPLTPVRKIERFVRRFEQVQYGKVRTENAPKDWTDYMDVSPEGVKTWDKNSKMLSNRFIRIV